MSYLGQDPSNGVEAERNRPILVMPPRRQNLKGWQLWKGRLALVVFVLFCLEIGIILIVLPWTRIWTGNPLLMRFPALREVLISDFVRGLISGFGIVDIWLGIAEAVRYREAAG